MLVELEAGGVRVEVEHPPVVVAERQRAADPVGRGLVGEHGAARDDRRLTGWQDGELGPVGRGDGDADPGRSGERGHGVGHVEDDVQREPECPQQRRRGAERACATVELLVRHRRPRQRWRVRVRLLALGVLRLVRAFVVAAGGVRVDEQLQLWVRPTGRPRRGRRAGG